MIQLDDLYERLKSGQIDIDLRNVIADRILEFIEEKKGSLGAWEKIHLGESISALGTTSGSDDQPTNTWLKLSLLSLEKAITPENERKEENIEMDENLEKITYEMLVGAIKELKSL